ncbi:hypothetical protein V2J94_35195 [Streptomyces sp. DSM 41524]|uniref:Uncharacterized protein n=1 Tax=Streptomyces asiaticus subsp. ignotus TaxID=3098222 RepID=A0ABU7Q6Q4_9ACTN|nr:hypothetical protein [Streptomyces sp. DSM 41524]
MRIKALWQPSNSLPGELLYSRSEYGFRFRTADAKDLATSEGGKGFASVSIDTLQIEVSVQTGRALYVWGYEPYTGWRNGNCNEPDAQPGMVVLQPSEPFEEGVSLSIPARHWDRRYDRSTGWFVTSPHDRDDAEWHVEIAKGIVLGGSTQGIQSVYLRPTFED